MFWVTRLVYVSTKRLLIAAPSSPACQQQLWRLKASDATSVVDERFVDLSTKLNAGMELAKSVFLIQPRVKWGAQKGDREQLMHSMDEAVALIETLPDWKVIEQVMVSVQRSVRTKHVFGPGTTERLARAIETSAAKSVFVNIDMLSGTQWANLSSAFRVPVYDRYTIVLQIFRTYAKSKEARLQIALAEIPYLRSRLKPSDDHGAGIVRGGRGSGESRWKTRRSLINEREHSLRAELASLQEQRRIHRQSQNKSRSMPTIAVVGYTNAGKTSLIKCLTQSESLEPRDRLFATLGVTVHAGTLPSRMGVLYADTVGFISDIPTGLLESFRATIEDDLLLHVRDLSHPCTVAQKRTVLSTLAHLGVPSGLLETMIEVGNKVDRLPDSSDLAQCELAEKAVLVSCTRGTRLAELSEQIERTLETIINAHHLTLRIPVCGPHLGFLHNEAGVMSVQASETGEFLFVRVLISHVVLRRFAKLYGLRRMQESDSSRSPQVDTPLFTTTR